MSALLGAELRRVLARRLVRVMALLAVLGVALAGVLVFVNTASVSEGDVVRQRAAADRAVEACLEGGPTEIDGRPAAGPPPGSGDRESFCRFATGGVDDPRFRLTSLEGVFQGLTAGLVVVGWLVGASVIGADWQARTITTVLTWEPRRSRVLLAKAAACVVVAVVFGLFVEALLAVALAPSVVWHGTTAGVDADWARSVAGVLARGSLLVAIATVIGFSVAAVGRNAAAALGIGFAYVLVVENVVGGFLEGSRPWLLLGNAIVLVSGESGGGGVAGRSVLAAAAYLAAVAGIVLLVATAQFRHRDVA